MRYILGMYLSILLQCPGILKSLFVKQYDGNSLSVYKMHKEKGSLIQMKCNINYTTYFPVSLKFLRFIEGFFIFKGKISGHGYLCTSSL